MRNVSKRCQCNIISGESCAYIEIVKKDNNIIRGIINEDFAPIARKFHWQHCRAGYIRTSKIDGHILLHRMVYEHYFGEIPAGKQVDHINGDGLDNRIENLRICTPTQNARNTRNRTIIKAGGIAGVMKDKRCGNSWRAQIFIDANHHIERTYKDEELAILQRLVWELEYFGDFAPQIDLIKAKYPFLLNYNTIKTTMQFSLDIETIQRIGASLMQDPHCPCMLQKNDNTICPCLPCRTKRHCHCGMFVPKENINEV